MQRINYKSATADLLVLNKRINKKAPVGVLLICCVAMLLVSCGRVDKIDVTHNTYIINLNSNLVHKLTCQTVPNMSEKNKIISSDPIEKILMDGYVACKNCHPERDIKYIVNIDICEFEKILHDEFGFGDDYTDRVLKLLSNLYEGINNAKNDLKESSYEYHKILASTVYQNWSSWGIIAGLYPTKNRVIKEITKNFKNLRLYNMSYFDSDSVSELYEKVIEQHNSAVKNGNDFAHMSATLSVYTHKSILKDLAAQHAGSYNGIYNLEVNCGFIGDICGTNGAKPSMNVDDYAADLDAINLYRMYERNDDRSIYEVFIEYYNGLRSNSINRAEEFAKIISIEKLNEYKNSYSEFLKTNIQYLYDEENPDYINRMNYFNNFLSHIINKEQTFTSGKYYKYSEY